MKQITNINEAIQQIGVENAQMDYGSTVVNKSELYHKAFTHEGVKCLIIRTTAGHLCGYVETEQDFDEFDYDAADELFSVLWGITYANKGWIGFDCAHYGQMSPLQKFGSDGRYFTLEEVTAMTKSLAEQESRLRGENMLDIKKVKQMLENGEEVRLECVDREGFIFSADGIYPEYNENILESGLVVRSVDTSSISVDGNTYNILDSEYKYFRIAEAKPTFDDLIDVAVQGVKDMVVEIKNLEINNIDIHNANNTSEYMSVFVHDSSQVLSGINFINSLYTETFVIESEEDILKVNIKDDSAKITLANKTELELSGSQDSSNQDGFALGLLLPNRCVVYYGISVLKGATVTQKRGA